MTKPDQLPPHVYTIPSHVTFVDVLADGILDNSVTADDPFALSDALVLVPTRRSVRSLRDAFLRAANKRGQSSILLPHIRPLGDVDETDTFFGPDEAVPLGDIDSVSVMSTLKRQFILARLIEQWQQNQKTDAGTGAANLLSHRLRLARELGRFMDALTTERIDPSKLVDVVPDSFAHHWQQTLAFIQIVTSHWPKILEAESATDGATRRNENLSGLAAQWRSKPPSTPIFAAGSTGSIPATAELLHVIGHLPRGAVILPGLDVEMDDRGWNAIDPVHPQSAMKQLLAVIGVDRDQVRQWQVDLSSRDTFNRSKRRQLINETLRPASVTDGWRQTVIRFETDEWLGGLDGLCRIDATTPHEEATIVSLIMRETLENGDATAALVTPDRVLARRVATALERWGVEVDDSAGTPLSETALGAFFRLVLQAVAKSLAPVSLLSMLKHPLCAFGHERAAFRRIVEKLEGSCLRGYKPGAGTPGMRKRLADQDLAAADRAAIESLLDGLEHALSPLDDLCRLGRASLDQWSEAHLSAVRALLAGYDVENGRGMPFADEIRDAMSALLEDIRAASDGLQPVDLRAYDDLLSTLSEERVVRPKFGKHAQLFIWGPLEARLQRADTIILGGLNEGTWPAVPNLDPWLNRPMRAQLGMSPPEQRVGLAAHDFAQLTAADRVVLTRSQKDAGSPTVPSRWLLRLETILKGAGAIDQLDHGQKYLDLARAMDRPASYRPVHPPQPAPPVETRPRSFSVTEIETWIRDPYAIYAKRILGLAPLPALEEDHDHRIWGIIVHRIADEFVRGFAGYGTDDAFNQFMQIARRILDERSVDDSVRALWTPRLEQIGNWFVSFERTQRSRVNEVLTEIRGEVALPATAGPIMLKARADRIDVQSDGVVIFDYKTGQVPTKSQVAAQLAPQLPLEAVIAREGAFANLAPLPVAGLVYIRLSGARVAADVRPITMSFEETAELSMSARERLLNWVDQFDHPQTPYLSRPRPMFARAGGDYDHLARVGEWPDEETGTGGS